MNTAINLKQQNAQRLTDAFTLFNQLSQNLTESYQSLEAQVTRLNQELSAVRNERMQTLMEKERIASRLQQLLAALPAAVVVLDQHEHVIDCNQHAVDYLGEPLLQQQWREIMQCSLFPVFDCPDERKLKDGRRVNIKRNFLHNDAGQIILLSDVTELRSLQDMLVQQKHLTSMGEMVAAMAHQVRTPLSTAILYASQMHKPALTNDKRQQFADKVLERLHHLERQVNDMLIFARQGRLLMGEFSLARMVADIEDSMRRHAVDFRLSNHVKDDFLHGNVDALLGALMNILNNAVQACSTQGLIEMTLSRQTQQYLKIVINDNGTGMTEEQQNKLFEPFFTTKEEGTGLGLAVVESVVLAHHGHIECHSKIGEGTEFTLLLPCFQQYSLGLSQPQKKAHQEETDYESV